MYQVRQGKRKVFNRVLMEDKMNYSELNKIKKFRWIEHPENNSLQQLQFNNCGMWYTLDGTTVNSVDDIQKYIYMDKYAKSLGYV